MIRVREKEGEWDPKLIGFFFGDTRVDHFQMGQNSHRGFGMGKDTLDFDVNFS